MGNQLWVGTNTEPSSPIISLQCLVEGTIRLKNQHRGGLNLPALLLILQEGNQGTVRGEARHNTLNAGMLHRAGLIRARVHGTLHHGTVTAGANTTTVGNIARLRGRELTRTKDAACRLLQG